MSLRPDVRTATNVAALLISGVLAGVIVAAAALPAVGFSGLVAKSATDGFQNLPVELKTVPLPQTSRLYASDGTLITSFYEENREITQLKDVPMVMRDAMIAAEDARFKEHNGVDVQGVVRAIVANYQADKITQGASTLTQQYVKNVLKYNAKTDRERRAAEAQNNGRKLREMRLAIAVEQKYSKDEILDRYLNIAFFGNDGYGIGAAAKVYFSKPVNKLTLGESAMLAGLVRRPTEHNPLLNEKSKAAAKVRRDYVLDRMADLEFITREQAAEAQKEPLKLKPNKVPGSCNAAAPSYGFYCDWFLSWWKRQPAFGKNPTQRVANLKRGGYKIYAAVDPKIQSAAQNAVNGQIASTSEFAAGTAVVQPGTGHVKALAINRIFGTGKNVGTNRPYTEGPLLTGGHSGAQSYTGFQAGSTFKMFTMVAALEQNIPLNISIHSEHQYRSTQRSTEPPSCGGRYCPSNASENMAGVHTMYSGFGESVNTFFVQLEEMAGVKASVEAAEKLGIVFRASRDGMSQGEAAKTYGNLSFTLGTDSVTPLDMANAYATIAARGKRCDTLPVLRILDRNGKEIKAPVAPKCKQTISPEVADAAADAARCPVGDGPASKCRRRNGVTAGAVTGRGGINRPVAGKTGTTTNNGAAWFAGFTPNLAAASFITNPDNQKMSVKRNLIPIPRVLFTQTMKSALAGLPVMQFKPPTRLKVYGIQTRVPNVEGMDPEEAMRRLRQAGFRARVNDEPVPSSQPAGKVAKTSPGGGDFASKGGVIAVFVSSGQPEPGTPPSTGPGRPGNPGPLPPFPPRPPNGPRLVGLISEP